MQTTLGVCLLKQSDAADGTQTLLNAYKHVVNELGDAHPYSVSLQALVVDSVSRADEFVRDVGAAREQITTEVRDDPLFASGDVTDGLPLPSEQRHT